MNRLLSRYSSNILTALMTFFFDSAPSQLGTSEGFAKESNDSYLSIMYFVEIGTYFIIESIRLKSRYGGVIEEIQLLAIRYS